MVAALLLRIAKVVQGMQQKKRSSINLTTMNKVLLLLLFLLQPLVVNADKNGICGDNLTYTYVDDTKTLTISGSGPMYNFPSNGYIGYGYYNCPWNLYKDDIEIIIMEDGVTSTGTNAFSGCSNLLSVSIPSSMTCIEDMTFNGCNNLISISIPNSVTCIGYTAFRDCTSLTSIFIPSSVSFMGIGAFEGCLSLSSVHISDLVAWCNIENPGEVFSSPYHLFLDGEEIKDLAIPNNIKSIGCDAFHNCVGLTSVTIPNSVTSIGSRAFKGCI